MPVLWGPTHPRFLIIIIIIVTVIIIITDSKREDNKNTTPNNFRHFVLQTMIVRRVMVFRSVTCFSMDLGFAHLAKHRTLLS